MDLNLYLSALSEDFTDVDVWKKNTIGATINHFDEDSTISEFDIAIIGVLEGRGAEYPSNLEGGTQQVRKQFYSLFNHFSGVNIVDLGDVKSGDKVSDTYFAVSAIVKELVKREVVPVIIGGSQDLVYASYTAYEELEQSVNMVSVDPTIDIGLIEEDVNDSNYMNHIVMHQPNYLFNYSAVGYQSYYTDDELVSLMSKLNFDAYRLGVVKNDMEEFEPIVRAADIFSFDMSSIRGESASATLLGSPNGFDGEESCRVCRYAGMSDKLSSFGIYNYIYEKDVDNRSAKLMAQMIWYFIDGYNNRMGDFPVASKSTCTKYHVTIEAEKMDLCFYKSEKSGRWWIDVPYPEDSSSKHSRHLMMPCSYNDYLQACDGVMPERWWQTYHKLI